jgi:hypothetical protein
MEAIDMVGIFDTRFLLYSNFQSEHVTFQLHYFVKWYFEK